MRDGGCPVHYEVGSLARVVYPKVSFLSAEPLDPARTHWLAVPRDSTFEANLSRCLQPGRQDERIGYRPPGCADALDQDNGSGRDVMPLRQATLVPVVPLVPGSTTGEHRLENLLLQSRPPLDRVLPGCEIVCVDHERSPESFRKAIRECALPRAAVTVNCHEPGGGPLRSSENPFGKGAERLDPGAKTRSGGGGI
jgi:hypothetical protein